MDRYWVPDPLVHAGLDRGSAGMDISILRTVQYYIPTGVDTSKRGVNWAHIGGPVPGSNSPVPLNGLTADVFSKPSLV